MLKGKVLLIVFLISFISFGFSACKGFSHTVSIVKNKKRFFPYDASKDRKKKRTKTVKYKILR